MVDINYTPCVKSLCIVWALLLLIVINASAQRPAQTIPSFSFKRVNKQEFTNKDLQAGKLLFFVFFDTQCDHCQRSIQYIGQHYSQFKKTAVYLITLDSTENIKPFMNKYGVSLKDKKNVLTITRETEYQIGIFLLQRTLLNGVLAIVISILIYFLGMPNPILWGVMAGLLESAQCWLAFCGV